MVSERIDEVQLRVRAQRFAQDDRRGALVHPDLDHPPRPRRRSEQDGGILGGVHRTRRDQSTSDRQRAQANVVAQANRGQTTQTGGQNGHRERTLCARVGEKAQRSGSIPEIPSVSSR